MVKDVSIVYTQANSDWPQHCATYCQLKTFEIEDSLYCQAGLLSIFSKSIVLLLLLVLLFLLNFC